MITSKFIGGLTDEELVCQLFDQLGGIIFRGGERAPAEKAECIGSQSPNNEDIQEGGRAWPVLGAVPYKGQVKGGGGVEKRRCCNNAVYEFPAPLAWTAYLKTRSSGLMGKRFGTLPLEKKMPERGPCPYGRPLPGRQQLTLQALLLCHGHPYLYMALFFSLLQDWGPVLLGVLGVDPERPEDCL